MKRLFDLLVAIPASLLTLPLVLVGFVLVWRSDPGNPLYLPRRIGQHGAPFMLFKLRTMVRDADKANIDTTIEGDPRLLPSSQVVRRYKMDELPQFWNVVLGNMSVIGPRPNVKREVDLYTQAERKVLSVKPGITDFSSIIFSDLAERLADHTDANIAYSQLVRPWKGRLGVFYVEHRTLGMDLALMWLTFVTIFDRLRALEGVARLLERHGADDDLIVLARGELELTPMPPYGGQKIVVERRQKI